MQDLHELPKLRDSLSYLYVEIFPTHVGVNRLPGAGGDQPDHFPHTREGEPISGTIRNAGVNFPHTRGGEPNCPIKSCPRYRFSPHTWGLTESKARCAMATRIFPTHVWVNRRPHFEFRRYCNFPHTRGGEPPIVAVANHTMAFSPHTWG